MNLEPKIQREGEVLAAGSVSRDAGTPHGAHTKKGARMIREELIRLYQAQKAKQEAAQEKIRQRLLTCAEIESYHNWVACHPLYALDGGEPFCDDCYYKAMTQAERTLAEEERVTRSRREKGDICA